MVIYKHWMPAYFQKNFVEVDTKSRIERETVTILIGYQNMLSLFTAQISENILYLDSQRREHGECIL